MKKPLVAVLLSLCAILISCTNTPQNMDYNDYPVYNGDDLGITWSPEQTLFTIYAPTAEDVLIRLFDNGTDGDSYQTLHMDKNDSGIWRSSFEGDGHGIYYTFQIKHKGIWLAETAGIYAHAVGVNGERAMITDFARTNPEGWTMDKSPEYVGDNQVVLYEIHVRDFSIQPGAGFQYPGKFLGFTESGLKNDEGFAIGIDHLAEMGITHLHIMPAFDFRSIDEKHPEQNKYNWGYDPMNYNVPEGSFSTDPYDAEVRIREFKEMVLALHKKGIRVVMDVVYNHTGSTEDSPFNLEVPGYYYRHNPDGTWSNASACGNEMASDRPMMRKYMIESLKWWMKEYHVDGFRFDLMGIHDLKTMNAISSELHALDNTVFLYGEGWTAGSTPLPDSLLALKVNTMKLDRIGAFSDDIRDAIKGHWSSETDSGFVTGAKGMEESIMFGVVASTFHPQINYQKVNYSDAPWSPRPSQTINYVTCHDNHTLFDKLKLSCPKASDHDIEAMHKLSNSIIFTSQGIPFLHAGVEFMRTKQGVHNSFESPDSINLIDWNLKSVNADMVQYYKDLIAFRKAHPALRMPSQDMIQKNLSFYPARPGVVSFVINNHANNDSFKRLAVMYNATKKTVPFSPGEGTWQVVFDQKGLKNIPVTTKGAAMVAPLSMVIMAELE